MTTDEKMDLLIELVLDLYDVSAKVAPRVGLELTIPAAVEDWRAEQKGAAHG